MQFLDAPILALESSCDETSAAVIHGRRIISSVVASQAELHSRWGGVVPEAAARAHIEAVIPVVDEALEKAGRPEIAGIAVTNRPGLVGALSVGVTAAKGLSLAWNCPLIGVHHLEGHLLSVCADLNGEPMPQFPLLSLVVSGGHTELVWVEEPGSYRMVGQTLDDAAGEAFDKGARLLGLGYPGGYAVQELAKCGNPKRYKLPRGLVKDPLNFSFSGLKTAMLRLVELEGDNLNREDAAASLQAAIVEVLIKKAMAAAEKLDASALALVGGVAANQALREGLKTSCNREGISFYTPDFSLCTDNAAMIGIVGSLRFAMGESSGMDLDPTPSAPLP
jgi:N6-L-threonylcarbamoyladenine synthase